MWDRHLRPAPPVALACQRQCPDGAAASRGAFSELGDQLKFLLHRRL
jgi:hypothetical protein